MKSVHYTNPNVNNTAQKPKHLPKINNNCPNYEVTICNNSKLITAEQSINSSRMSPTSRRGNNSLQVSGSFLFSSNYARPKTQYRATQMWHKSLEIFLTGVPLTQHRSKLRFWRVFESTFTGAEALNWFHEQLKQVFEQEISREQTKKLMGKFYRAGVFCSVDIQPETDRGLDENDFKDSQLHIYRLAMDRPGLPPSIRTPSPTSKKISPKINKNYSVEIKPLSTEEKEKIYFDLMIEWLTPMTSAFLDSLQPTSNVHTNLMSNTQSNSEIFPSWLFPAMRYLANYPEEALKKPEVDYAEFEHDVLILLFDYFFTFFERVRLFIPDSGLFINVLNNIEPQLPHCKYQEKFPFPKSEFEEIDKIFTPKSKTERFIMGKNRRRRIFDDSSASMFEESVSVKPMGIVDTSRYRSSVYFATDFDASSPVTRVLSQSEMYAYDNPTLNLSPADLINHPKYGSLRRQFNGGRKSLSVGDLADSSDDDGGFATVESNLPETRRPTIEALTLLLLTLDPVKRKHVEILFRFMGKVEKNLQVSFGATVPHKDLLYNFLSPLIIDSPAEPPQRDLISFMIANVDNLFGGEYLENFKKAAEDSVSERQIKKIPIPNGRSLNTKENLGASYCSKISMIEYEDQRLLGETAKSLRNLLDEVSLLKDEKLRKKQLKKFQKEYPHIYSEKFNNSSMTEDPSSPFQQQRSNKKRTPFGVLI